MVDHAVPEAGFVFLDRLVLLFEKVEIVADGLTAGALVVNGCSDFVEPSLCLFVPGSQGLIAFFVFGLVLRNVGVLVDAVLDLPGDKVDFKGQVVLLFLKGAGIKGRILDGPEGFNGALPVGEYFVGGTHGSSFDRVIRKVVSVGRK